MITLFTGFIVSSMMLLFSPSVVFSAKDNSDLVILDRVAAEMEREVNKLGGIKVVSQQLKFIFHVDEEMIMGLRELKVSYGEMPIFMALAEQMPGGITQGNLYKILERRQAGVPEESWANVAVALGIDMRPVFRRVRDIGLAIRTPQEAIMIP